MATLYFDEGELSKELQGISADLRVAFAAACAARLMVAYTRFSSRTRKGDPLVLSAILGRLWLDLGGTRMSDAELEEHIETCETLIPDEDGKDWVIEQAAAEDAVSALAYALRCRRNGQPREATWAARCAYEALDDFVINQEDIDTNAPGAEHRVLSNPLVQAELGRQARDLHELVGGLVTIEQLRDRANAEAAIFIPQNPRTE